MKKQVLAFTMALSICCAPLTAYGATNASSDNSYINKDNRDANAIFDVQLIDVARPSARMSSIEAGKTQVMAITVKTLKPGKYLETSGDKKLPAKGGRYWAICTSRTKGTTAEVGLVYYNKRGAMISSGKRASLSGVGTYGSMLANSKYANYGFVINTGKDNLGAAYVIMK